MAKINHNNYLDTIDELIRDAQKKGVVHLFTDGDELTGRELNINGAELLNFGTCGYLGLEMEEALKEGAIDFTRRYGTQFSVSRTYVSSGTNLELEELLRKIYNRPVLVSPSTSTSHIAVIPTIIRDNSAIILDQQVHMSVQTACQLVKPRGIPVEMIRHSNLEMLERMLKDWQGKYDKVWYMIDGVYSMYGDVAPLEELVLLMEKYSALHVYVDDAHGMSWYGKNGAGYVFDKVGVPEKMVLVTTLAKGFGVTGGVAVFPTEEMYEKVKVFGGPLTYSHPIAPPLLGAAIASANLHLSEKIYAYQQDLKERIAYCNRLLEVQELPVISNPDTPIYFIGMGHPRVGYNMVKRIIDDGFYLNIGLFPAVPVKNTGVRFTLTRHQKLKDIKELINCIAYHFPKALREEGIEEDNVLRAFKLLQTQSAVALNKEAATPVIPINITSQPEYNIQHETSIKQIDQLIWDKLLGQEGSFTWEGLQAMEVAFSGNEKKEDNWDFHYFIIYDKYKVPILATFATIGIYKDDLLAHASVSMQIEEERAQGNPYYLASKTLGMGCLLTEGKHLYIDRARPDWKEVFSLLIAKLSDLQEKTNSENIILRDFEEADIVLRDFLLGEGFVKLAMPNANIISDINEKSIEEFLPKLSAKNRAHVRGDILKYENRFEVEIKTQLTEEETDIFYDQYLQIKRRNFAINYYDYPKKVFTTIQGQPGWEFIILKLKPEYDKREVRLPVSIGACYRTATQFCPMVLGLDYDFVYDHKVYKQALYQVFKRAQSLGIPKIYLGFSADTDKRKLGAKQIPRVAYLQAKDNFNFEKIESFSVKS